MVFSINYLRKKLQLCGVCVVYVCFYIYEDVRTLGAALAVSTLPPSYSDCNGTGITGCRSVQTCATQVLQVLQVS